MELGDYVRILRQRGWLIPLLAILTAVAAFAFSRMQDPVYKSTANLLITSRPDFGQTQAAKELIRSDAAWLYSSFRATEVIDKLDLEIDALTLLGDVRIAPRTDANIIQIDVEDSNGDLANDISRAWAEELILELNRRNAGLQKADWIEAQLIDNPRYGLDSPKTRVNTLAGGVFGSLLGVMMIVGLEWWESGRIRRADDVERFLEVPVVGRIPK